MRVRRKRNLILFCIIGVVICGVCACDGIGKDRSAYSEEVISGADSSEETSEQEQSAAEQEASAVTAPLEAEEFQAGECDLTLNPNYTEENAAAEQETVPDLTETSAAQCEPTSPEAPSKTLIDSYGYAEDGSSLLSFDIQPGEVIDGGDHYEVTAIYAQAIEAPGNLEMGDSVTLVFNEMTGEEKTLTRKDNGSLYDEQELEYYYEPTEDGSPVVLYWWSDDRVDKPVCEGKLYIRKHATSEIVIAETVEFVTEEMLANGAWYNGVYFDEQGYVTRLCFIGD